MKPYVDRYVSRYGRINIQLSEREEKAVTSVMDRAIKSGFITMTPTHALRTIIEYGVQHLEKLVEKQIK